MTEDKTFKLDNVVIEFIPTLFRKRSPQLPFAFPTVEPEPFGQFDAWVMVGCYALLDPKKPTDPVTVTLTEFVDILDFSRTVSEALGHYRTFPSEAYQQVKEALHRLFTVDVRREGEWLVKTGKQGRPKRQVIEYHFRVLASYAYIYPADEIPPDQLPDSKRRNVNRAKTSKGEDGPPIYERVDRRPIAIQFRISEELLRGLTKTDPHIGATTLRVEIFKLRRKLANRHTAVKLILWVCRQTNKSPRISLDKLCRRLQLFDAKGRNIQRTRDETLESLALLRELGVIESFSYDSANDGLVITKAADWHFPAQEDDEEGFLDG